MSMETMQVLKFHPDWNWQLKKRVQVWNTLGNIL